MWKLTQTVSPSYNNKGSLLLREAFQIYLWLKRNLVNQSFLRMSEAYIASTNASSNAELS